MVELTIEIGIAIACGIIAHHLWQTGYIHGKADGIREARYMLEERERENDKLRDLVYCVLKTEVKDD